MVALLQRYIQQLPTSVVRLGDVDGLASAQTTERWCNALASVGGSYNCVIISPLFNSECS